MLQEHHHKGRGQTRPVENASCHWLFKDQSGDQKKTIKIESVLLNLEQNLNLCTYFCQKYSWEISSLISWMRWGHPPWNNLNASISQVKNNWIDSRKGFPISNKYKVDPALINKQMTHNSDRFHCRITYFFFFCRLTNFVLLLNSDGFHCSRRIQSNAQRLLTAFSGWFLKFQVFKFTLHVSYIIFIFHVLDCTYAQKNIAVSSYIWCF